MPTTEGHIESAGPLFDAPQDKQTHELPPTENLFDEDGSENAPASANDLMIEADSSDDEGWEAELTDELRARYFPIDPPRTKPTLEQQETLTALENILLPGLLQVQKLRSVAPGDVNNLIPPELHLLKSFGWTALRMVGTLDSLIHFARATVMVAQIHWCVRNRKIRNARDLYYFDPALYGTVRIATGCMTDICRTTGLDRDRLFISECPKSMIAGVGASIKLKDGSTFQLHPTMPAVIPPIRSIDTVSLEGVGALWLAFFEKQGPFDTALREGLVNAPHLPGPGVAIVGRGKPDRRSRFVTAMFERVLGLRVFGIVDGDSDGLDIAAIVKFGVGGALGPEPLLMSPGAELIGVIYEDFQRLGGETNQYQHMTPREQGLAEKMLANNVLLPRPFSSTLKFCLYHNIKGGIAVLERARFNSIIPPPNSTKGEGADLETLARAKRWKGYKTDSSILTATLISKISHALLRSAGGEDTDTGNSEAGEGFAEVQLPPEPSAATSDQDKDGNENLDSTLTHPGAPDSSNPSSTDTPLSGSTADDSTLHTPPAPAPDEHPSLTQFQHDQSSYAQRISLAWTSMKGWSQAWKDIRADLTGRREDDE